MSAPIPPASTSIPSCRRKWTTPSPAGSRRSPSTGTTRRADLVHALRDALDGAAGGTIVGASPPRRAEPDAAGPFRSSCSAPCCCRRRRRGGAARRRRPEGGRHDRAQDGEGDGHASRARRSSRRDDRGARRRPRRRRRLRRRQPVELNDQGFELMKAGDYEGALPLLEQAVAGLSGAGSSPRPTRATTSRSRGSHSAVRRGRRAARPLGADSGQAQGDQRLTQGGEEELRRGALGEAASRAAYCFS